MITKSSQKLIDLIKKFEGCRLNAYLCPASVWTIGYGSTFYEDDEKVREGQIITQDKANELLLDTLGQYEQFVNANTRDDINQNQFDALVDFAYNCGNANLKSSTLLKKVNVNPQDKTIKDEFMKWTHGGGVVLNGLVRRRSEESELYFKK